jgi:hypothetical protein
MMEPAQPGGPVAGRRTNLRCFPGPRPTSLSNPFALLAVASAGAGRSTAPGYVASVAVCRPLQRGSSTGRDRR